MAFACTTKVEIQNSLDGKQVYDDKVDENR